MDPSPSPSLHKTLAHSWELIKLNNGFGLGSLDESGLEGNNIILRGIRIRLSRKTSQNNNLTDTLQRMWLGSDPLVNVERAKSKSFCKYCEEMGHSTRYCKKNNISATTLDEDDYLFES